MKNAPIIELFRKEFIKKNKHLSKDVLENKVNLLINIKFFCMTYDKKIMNNLF